jgi:hypothetical protein
VAGSCKYGNEPAGSGAKDVVSSHDIQCLQLFVKYYVSHLIEFEYFLLYLFSRVSIRAEGPLEVDRSANCKIK